MFYRIQSNFWIAVMVIAYCLAFPLIAKEKWILVRSSDPHQKSGAAEPSNPEVEVFTDAGESAGRRVLSRLLLLRGALAPHGKCPQPIRLILFANEREFSPFRSDSVTKGFHRSGSERDTIVTFEQGSKMNQVLAHEFVHLLRSHKSPALSKWLEEGLAEYFSTIAFRGDVGIAGQEIESHSALLKNPHDGELLNYARAWAVVRAVVVWTRGSAETRWPLWKSEPGSPHVETLSDDRGGLLRASLLLQLEKREQAAKLFEQIAARNPDSANAALGLGMLAMSDNRRDVAKRHFERAIALGAGAEATFEYAMLLRDSDAPREEVNRWVEKTLELSPSHAEAHLLSGILATTEGRLDTALRHLQQAAEILPRDGSVWHALGYAQFKAGQMEAARDSARRAGEAAKDDEERTMAASLRELVDTPRLARAGSGVVTPESWRAARGDQRTEGMLVQIDCTGGGAVLRVRDGTRTLRLQATPATRVVSGISAEPEPTSSGPIELPCSLPHPIKVKVEYRGGSERLELVSLELLER